MTYCIAGKFGGGKVWQINSCREFGERKVWQIDRSANRLLIVCTNLDGFSLAYHGRFTKIAKLSGYTINFQ